MLLCAAALLVSAPSLLAAGEPQRVAPSFDVKLGPGPAVEMTFALALSEVSSYPVTITAIGGAVEEQLWTGSLSEGVYQFQAPLTKITSGPLKLVLKTKVTNRTEGGGQSFVTYQKWEGTIR
jgi:hypothetical protein